MTNPRENPSQGRRLALIIANENYSRSNDILPHSIKKAEDLSDLLTRVNFTVTMFRDISKDIMEMIKEFEKSIEPEDLVFFYFSGHSCHFNHINYLIPTDDTQLVSGLDVETFGANVNNLIKRLTTNKQPYASILVFDCCRPYLLTSTSTSDPKLPKQGFCPMRLSQEMKAFIQLACGINEVVRSNLFAQDLLESIFDENVEITEIFLRITNNVFQKSNHKEQPFSINKLPEPIYLNEVRSKFPSKWKMNGRSVAGEYGPGHTLNTLHCPKGVCVTDNRTVFVADDSNHRIMRFKRGVRSGRRFAGRNISGYGSDQLCRPSDVLFDKVTKSCIICDRHNRRVLQCFSGSKTCAKVLIENIECYGVAMDNEGNLYVSDTECHEVRRYRPGDVWGTVVAGGNGQGSRAHQLNYPTYICIGRDQGVYVSDSRNNRVMRWNEDATEGDVVAGGKGRGSNREQLDCPTGICVDELNTVYVADHWNNRVMRWPVGKSYGDVIAGRLLPGDHSNQLNGPEGLAFDRHYNLYVVDSGNHRVQCFDAAKA